MPLRELYLRRAGTHRAGGGHDAAMRLPADGRPAALRRRAGSLHLRIR
jgi:hypothetical protein